MANTQISINSEAAYNVMTYVANSSSILEGDVSGKLSSGFDALTSLGFLDNSLSKVQSQVKSLIDAHKSIISEIASHISSVQEQEDDLQSGYQNRTYGGGYSGGSNGGSGGEAATPEDTSSFELQQEDDGLQISADELCEMLDLIDDEHKENFINLIKTSKDSDVSLIELLLDNKNSKKLYKVLKKIFGDKLNIDEMTLEDYEKVQKKIVNMIVNSEVDIPALSEKTVLAGKDYLSKVCKDNNINPSDLFFDDRYKHTLKKSIQDIYDGNIHDTMSEGEVNNFRAHLDTLADSNNITVEDLIENHIDLVVTGG